MRRYVKWTLIVLPYVGLVGLGWLCYCLYRDNVILASIVREIYQAFVQCQIERI